MKKRYGHSGRPHANRLAQLLQAAVEHGPNEYLFWDSPKHEYKRAVGLNLLPAGIDSATRDKILKRDAAAGIISYTMVTMPVDQVLRELSRMDYPLTPRNAATAAGCWMERMTGDDFGAVSIVLRQKLTTIFTRWQLVELSPRSTPESLELQLKPEAADLGLYDLDSWLKEIAPAVGYVIQDSKVLDVLETFSQQWPHEVRDLREMVATVQTSPGKYVVGCTCEDSGVRLFVEDIQKVEVVRRSSR